MTTHKNDPHHRTMFECVDRDQESLPGSQTTTAGAVFYHVQAYRGTGGLGTWGTDIEILTLVHLLNTPVYTYMDDIKQWQHFTPGNIDPTLDNDITQMAMYFTHYAGHFEVVLSTVAVTPQVVHGTRHSTRRCH